MSSADNLPDVFDELPTIKDTMFSAWLRHRYVISARRAQRWKDHTDQRHGLHEYNLAVNTMRAIRECAEYETQLDRTEEAHEKVIEILSRSMERGEIPPAVYGNIINILTGKNP